MKLEMLFPWLAAGLAHLQCIAEWSYSKTVKEYEKRFPRKLKDLPVIGALDAGMYVLSVAPCCTRR